MRKFLLRTVLAVLPAAVPAAQENLGIDAQKGADAVSSAYIAPENLVLFRMRLPNGSYYEFEHDFDRPHLLFGPNGWRGRIKGEDIFVRSGPKVAGGRAELVFRTGRLVSFKQGETKIEVPYEAERGPTEGGAPYWFGDEWTDKSRAKEARKTAAQVQRVFFSKWAKSGRLAWPFKNPNENGILYASIALLAVFLLLRRGRAARIAGGAVFAAAFAATLATFSRGALLALFAALVPVVALRLRGLLHSKAFLAAVAVLAVAAGAWFGLNRKQLSRGFGENSWSNQVRVDMWKAAPEMMAEAPDGWSFAHVGRSYMDWHQPLEVVSLPGSLMNEHLTRMTGSGRTGRRLYVFAWFAAFALLGAAALKTKDAAPLAMWIFFAIAAWFNPVGYNWMLWLPLAAATVLAVALHPRAFGLRKSAVLLACSAALAVAAVWAVENPVAKFLSAGASRECSVEVRGRAVCVNGSNPRIWIVDDGKALGGVLACKEIRAWYAYDPSAPAVGYVRNVKDLPESGVGRLVLGGKAGADWMDMVAKKVRGGGRPALPEEVVFISPPFPPSALPPGFVEQCNARIFAGEFAAKYEPEYADPPEWAAVVPGMELYIPRWMEIATAVAEDEEGEEDEE